MSDYISSKKLKFVYAAEDCTSVISKITYNTRSNNFTGFVPPLKGGLPQINTFSTESFAELQHWFSTVSMSHLLNAHMIQPATSTSDSCAPFLLSAYGTDNCFTAQDIVLRWVNIVNECTKNGAKLVGFATDCDSRYLRSIRLLMGFFSNMPKQQFHQHENAFHVDIPQDSVHICTKLWNRILSSTTTILIGDQAVTVDHLLQLIKSSSKASHNLVKSDVIPKDRQNYQSCEKISSEAAFNALSSVPNSRATQIYLQIIRNIRLAFISTETKYIDRIYYAWLNVFIVRFWYTWFTKTTKNELDSILNQRNYIKQNIRTSTKRQYFMAHPALFSIEINSHTLVYIALLVIQCQLPEECLNVSLFNSQSCEREFRLCRSMSGPFSSIVNFTVEQFIQRVKKLSSDADFLFPSHHKHSKIVHTGQNTSSDMPLKIEMIEASILQTYSDATRLMCEVNIYHRNDIPTLDELSRITRLQLQKLQIADYSIPSENETDLSSDSDDGIEDEEENTFEDESDDDDSIRDDEDLSNNVLNVSGMTYQGMRVFDSINPNLAKPYFVLNINGTKKYLHKQTAIWLLSNDKPTLPSDRLKRVMTNKQS
ncbi:unnamed protein product [Rotaria magnacalcarata]|nr:unnamed protein product [Rotaria magnacalcarata]